MEQHVFDNMVKLLPIQLTVKYTSVLSELHEEITTEFENNMRKSRGNTVLVDYLGLCYYLLYHYCRVRYVV